MSIHSTYGYICIQVDDTDSLYIHRYVLGRAYGDDVVVDHESGVRVNAMRSDLVSTTAIGNSSNRTVARSNTGIVGVSYNQAKNQYTATMRTHGISFIEDYDTVEEAAYARNELGKELHPDTYKDLKLEKPINFRRRSWNTEISQT